MANICTVKTDDFEMDYCSFGKGDRVFVTIPGLAIQRVMGAKDAIAENYKLFSDDFTAYVFDRRKDIPDDYSIEDMADDTALAMKKLGLKDTYMFGASQGGMIAMVIAIKNPELVKKLVLGSTSSHIHTSQRTVLDKWIALAEKKDKKALCSEYGKEIYPPEVFE